jgi:hypothetical protein
MSTKITAGTYKATVVGAYLGESAEKKTPYYGIEFLLDNNENIDWLAYLTDGTKERNLNTLLTLGFKGTRLSDLADTSKKISDLFEFPEDDIFVVIEMESYEKDGVTKEVPRVQFVNVGERKTVMKFDHQQAVKVFKSHTFDGDIQRIKKSGPTLPAKKAKPADAPKTSHEMVNEETNFTADEIPF